MFHLFTEKYTDEWERPFFCLARLFAPLLTIQFDIQHVTICHAVDKQKVVY